MSPKSTPAAVLLLAACACFAQSGVAPLPPPPQPAPKPPKRILGIIPNYRTTPATAQYMPISSREKWKLAAQDAFDPGSFILAAGFAGQGALSRNEPSFGHGVPGYARYFAAAYGDVAIGDFMTGAIYPSLLHQDPRYFRLGTGSTGTRLRHAVTQIFWTRTDSGGHQFNYSEIAGNATAAAIGTAYYPSNRTAGAVASKWGVQVGVDILGNILKEFWPDVDRKITHKPKSASP
ncbi:MAG TPA: hypothetical protein VH640_24730 [Bryobacteraceae bacterium]|jgi:hypothetical protein